MGAYGVYGVYGVYIGFRGFIGFWVRGFRPRAWRKFSPGAAGAGGGLLRLLHDEPPGGSSEGTERGTPPTAAPSLPLSECLSLCVSGDLLAPGFHLALFHALLPELLPASVDISGRVESPPRMLDLGVPVPFSRLL